MLNFARLLMPALLALAAVLCLSSKGASEEFVWVPAHAEIRIVDPDLQKALPLANPTESFTENGLTFNIYYEDVIVGTGQGFDGVDSTAARHVAREVFRYIARVLNVNATLDVVFEESETDASGALASAGTYYRVQPGFQQGATGHRVLTGEKLSPFLEEISVVVDFGYNWNISLDDPAPHEIDFFTVILHEITHGLGFASLMGHSGDSRLDLHNTYTTFDSFLSFRDDVSKDRAKLLIESPPMYWLGFGNIALKPPLYQYSVVFDGSNSLKRYNSGLYPLIYTPFPFQYGSSLSHFYTNQIYDGPAVMEASIGPGEAYRQYTPVDLGVLIDLGFENAELLQPVIACPSTVLTDGGFEDSPNTAWTFISDSATSPICDIASCGIAAVF